MLGIAGLGYGGWEGYQYWIAKKSQAQNPPAAITSPAAFPGKPESAAPTIPPANGKTETAAAPPPLPPVLPADNATYAPAAGKKTPEVVASRGGVEILTDPPGARAVLTSSDRGEAFECVTRCRFDSLLAGRYTLELTREGFRRVQKIVNVRGGAVEDEHVVLSEVIGFVMVVSDPPGADIFVKGQKQGQQTPAQLQLAEGTHHIRVERAGYEAVEKNVPVEGESYKTLNVPLQRSVVKTGRLKVQSEPEGAEILVDGKSVGKTTPAMLDLPVGEYTITILLKGRAEQKKTVKVKENETTVVNETLK